MLKRWISSATGDLIVQISFTKEMLASLQPHELEDINTLLKRIEDIVPSNATLDQEIEWAQEAMNRAQKRKEIWKDAYNR